jgi:hypothetical protein
LLNPYAVGIALDYSSCAAPAVRFWTAAH